MLFRSVKPLDIDSQVQVKLDRGDFVLVEFSLRPRPDWTPQPTQAGTPQALAQAITPKAAVQPAPTAKPPQPTAPTQAMALGVAPAPTEQGGWVWQGIEYERKPGAATGSLDGVLAVRVVGVPDRRVFIRENSGGWNATLVTGQKPEYGDFSTDVGGLTPGTYTVKPLDIDSEVQVKLDRGDFVLVEFALRPPPAWTPQPTQAAATVAESTAAMPSPPAGGSATPTLVPGWTWLGSEIERKPAAQPGAPSGTLIVRAVALPDRQVIVREVSSGWTITAKTGSKLEGGAFVAPVEGLAPGTYAIRLADVPSETRVKLQAGEQVTVQFNPQPAAAQ